ncbi:MAG: di-trans,poly-cis-decaprenylcistransferase [Bacteroidales bacterium]|nr:di-trans,poly-cis-decaprenylcistransferase [Bacteroidales bacterium]
MENRIPVHVSIIMDGNGRWARERGLERVKGHLEGVSSVRACAGEAVRQGVKYLSLFAFSEENWGRPREEVDALMALMMTSIRNEVPTLMDNGVRFVVLGNRDRLPLSLRTAIAGLERATAKNGAMTLIVFLSYSGKWDIFQAARKMAADLAKDPSGVKDISDFDRYLVTAGYPDPDLIIRTSGEQRISNYLLWQGAYSEFLFVDELWPDFREDSFRRALAEYAKRDRRYGKVK